MLTCLSLLIDSSSIFHRNSIISISPAWIITCFVSLEVIIVASSYHLLDVETSARMLNHVSGEHPQVNLFLIQLSHSRDFSEELIDLGVSWPLWSGTLIISPTCTPLILAHTAHCALQLLCGIALCFNHILSWVMLPVLTTDCCLVPESLFVFHLLLILGSSLPTRQPAPEPLSYHLLSQTISSTSSLRFGFLQENTGVHYVY